MKYYITQRFNGKYKIKIKKYSLSPAITLKLQNITDCVADTAEFNNKIQAIKFLNKEFDNGYLDKGEIFTKEIYEWRIDPDTGHSYAVYKYVNELEYLLTREPS